jgi:hypothetical protein
MTEAVDTFWTHRREVALNCMANLLKFGAPGGTRTRNPQIRSLVLCPIELRAHIQIMAEREGFEPSVPFWGTHA